MQELEEEFAFLDDWEDRYRYVIDMGKAMPTFDEKYKTTANQIQGCVSKVWLVARRDQQGRYSFIGDSDALIVRGLIAVLLRLVQQKTANQIHELDLVEFFHKIGLSDNLSPQRANGLQAMIKRINQICTPTT